MEMDALKKPRIICLIPARYDATRYPGKLMTLLVNKTVIRYTYENVVSMNLFDYVAVVTNSDVIRDEIEKHGGNVIYMPVNFESGSDRIAAALENLEGDIILNVQGDEPFVRPEPLQDMIGSFNLEQNDNMVASLMRPMDNEDDVRSSDFVKVVCDKNNFALYFSRSVVPFQKKAEPKAVYYEHIGVYGFTRKSLLQFSSLEPTPLERIESIECLRFLENSIPIKMIETPYHIIEIDTEADRIKAEELIRSGYYK